LITINVLFFSPEKAIGPRALLLVQLEPL